VHPLRTKASGPGPRSGPLPAHRGQRGEIGSEKASNALHFKSRQTADAHQHAHVEQERSVVADTYQQRRIADGKKGSPPKLTGWCAPVVPQRSMNSRERPTPTDAHRYSR